MVLPLVSLIEENKSDSLKWVMHGVACLTDGVYLAALVVLLVQAYKIHS